MHLNNLYNICNSTFVSGHIASKALVSKETGFGLYECRANLWVIVVTVVNDIKSL